ncbi:hypothetical protein N7528_009020 [Penicillium herquei]|nr:hypothetical protein N7528_009020 [Penicillium herquei]
MVGQRLIPSITSRSSTSELWSMKGWSRVALVVNAVDNWAFLTNSTICFLARRSTYLLLLLESSLAYDISHGTQVWATDLQGWISRLEDELAGHGMLVADLLNLVESV